MTLNPSSPPSGVIHCQWTTLHPVPSPAAEVAARQLAGVQGSRGVWYCGAYQGYGFHEDGLKVRACQTLLGARAQDVHLWTQGACLVHGPSPQWLSPHSKLLFVSFICSNHGTIPCFIHRHAYSCVVSSVHCYCQAGITAASGVLQRMGSGGGPLALKPNVPAMRLSWMEYGARVAVLNFLNSFVKTGRIQ